MGDNKKGKNTLPAVTESPRWQVDFHDEFKSDEWRRMDTEQRKALIAAADALAQVGPQGGRPLIGTLDNPSHPNMKELRYDAHDGTEVWRAAFAFDPSRKAIVLVAGDKQGKDESLFYKELLRKANKRFNLHLKALKTEQTRKSDEAASKGSRHKRRSS